MNRLDDLTSWHADWTGLRVAVLGLGATGVAAADTLAELGCEGLVVAERPADARQRILSVLAGAVAFVAASVLLGTWGGHLLTAALIVMSLVADVAVSISIADERSFCGTTQFVLRVLVSTVPLALAALARIRTTEAARRGVARALTAAVVSGPLLALAVVQTLPTGICGD